MPNCLKYGMELVKDTNFSLSARVNATRIAVTHTGGIGGTEVVVARLVTYLKSLNYECDEVVLPTNIFTKRFLKFPLVLFENWVNFLIIRWMMSRRLTGYDLVIALQPHSLYLKHRNMIPFILHQFKTAYDLFDYYIKGQKPIKKVARRLIVINRRLIDQIALQWVKRFPILTISQTVNNRLKRFWNIEAGEIVYAGGYDEPIEYNDGIYALYLGRLDWNIKRLSLVYEAAKLLPSISFVVAGDPDPYPRELQNFPQNIKIKSYNSLFTKEERNEFYQKAFCIIFPARDEDYGLVPVEAMAAGKPCIVCSDGGGATETIMHKKTGLIVSPTPEAIADAVQELKETYKNFATACYERAKLFSWKLFLDKMGRKVEERLNLKHIQEDSSGK